MAEVYGSRRRPRKRWGRRLLITFLVLLVFLLVIFAVADRAGAAVAERIIADRVAEQVSDQKATSDRPDVTIEGIPFLNQVVRGEYQEIKIGLRNFSGPAGQETIRMPLLDVRAQDVRAPLQTLRSGQGDIVAGTVTGNGTIDYATITRLINRKGVKLGEKGGKLAVTGPVRVDLLNRDVTINGTADIDVLDGDRIRVRFAQVTAEGLPDNPLVQNALNNYAKSLSLELQVPALPLALAVEKVQPTPAGLAFTAGAKDVALNSGGR